MKFYAVSDKELSYYLGKKGTLLIDLRTPEDYMSGHLPGAVNIPFERLKYRKELLSAGSFETVIFYCERGNLSLRMARYFSEQGYHALSLSGGMASYHGKLE
jgi:rhodanese-related sulfurtransferase